jgi:hypothetical protein
MQGLYLEAALAEPQAFLPFEFDAIIHPLIPLGHKLYF